MKQSTDKPNTNGKFSPEYQHRNGQGHLHTAAWSQTHSWSFGPGYSLPWAPDNTGAEMEKLPEFA